VDQLKAYSPKHDQLYFTMRFIDGLQPDIKSVVLLQMPKDLDTAATLALLQEEVSLASLSRPSRTGDWSSSTRPTPAPRLPLPLRPLPRADKLAPVQLGAEFSLATLSVDSKLVAIKSYHRAMGLCYKCSAKWSKDHKCSPEVLLAVEAV
jgi:hypothetical protein